MDPRMPTVEAAFERLGWSRDEIARDHLVNVIESAERAPVQRHVDLVLTYQGRTRIVPFAAVWLTMPRPGDPVEVANTTSLWARTHYFVVPSDGKLALFETSLQTTPKPDPIASADTSTAASIARAFRGFLGRSVASDVVAGRAQLRLDLANVEDYLASMTAQSLALNVGRCTASLRDFYDRRGNAEPALATFRIVVLTVVARILADRGELSDNQRLRLQEALDARAPTKGLPEALAPAIDFFRKVNAPAQLAQLPDLPSAEALGDFRRALSGYTFARVDDSVLGTLYEALVTSARGAGRFYSQPAITKLVFDSIEAPKPSPESVGIADLSCGSGGFLTAAIEWVQRHKLQGHLLGVDISDTATALAQLTLHLRGARTYATVETRDGLIPKDGRPYANIHIVVGNPPFGPYPADADPAALAQLERDYDFFRLRRERALLFVEQALSIIPEGGWLGMVLPLSKLAQAGGTPLRELLLRTSRVHRVVLLPSRAFKSRYPTAIVVAQRESDPEKRRSNSMQLCCFEADASLRDVEAQAFAVSNPVPQRLWEESPGSAPPLFAGTPIGLFLRGLCNGAIPLGRLATIGEGLIFGRAGTDGLQLPSAAAVLRDAKAVQPYRVDTSKATSAPREPLFRARTPELFAAPKLVVHRLRHPTLRKRLVAGLDLQGVYTHCNLLNIVPAHASVRATYLAAILNSDLINAWFGLHQYGFTLTVKELRAVPVRLTDSDLEDEVERLVLKVADPHSTESSCLRVVRELNRIVYDIYGLEPEARHALDAYQSGQCRLGELADAFPAEWRRFPTAGRGLFGYQGVAAESGPED